MKPSKCNRCDRRTIKLTPAFCGHFACYQCIKIDKPLRKCEECCQNNYLKSRNLSQEKQKNHKEIRSQQISRTKQDQHLQKTQRKPFKTIQDHQQPSKAQPHQNQLVYCRQHHEPFSMFCINTKKVLCAVCLYKMNGYSNVLPIKNAQHTLQKQNKLQRQESAVALDQVKKAYTLCKNNKKMFEQYYRNHMQTMQATYQTLQTALRQSFQKNTTNLKNFFTNKFNECDQASSDLDYLCQTLMEYRNNNKDNIPLSQSIFINESYRIIKKTLNTIDLNFNTYQGKEVKLMSLNTFELIEKIDKMITLKLDLPLRKSEKKMRSMSARQTEVRTSVDDQHKNVRAQSRKDRSTQLLYGNAEDDLDDSLYKKMLRIRFKGS